MAVLRIVANLAVDDPAKADAFYTALLGLEVLMDQGWIRTYGNAEQSRTQLSFMRHGGNDAPVPDISIEVDDLDAVLDRAGQLGLSPVYGPAVEPWGVRRFFVRDPFGRLVNILQHMAA